MLPPNATSHSHQLFTLAHQLVQNCPKSLYDEVTVSGSVSRGVADAYSDIDLNFWVDEIQSIATYQTWIDNLGLDTEACRPAWQPREESCHLEYTINGIKFNLLWQSWRELDNDLAPLNQLELPADPTLPWMVVHALPIGDAPRFLTYQKRLSEYPEALSHKIVELHLTLWRRMIKVPQIFFAVAQAGRGQVHDLRRRLLMTIDSILTVLFAHNRLWQPDFKWFEVESKRMAHKPADLVKRVHHILCGVDGTETIDGMTGLLVDTLNILSTDFEVDDLRSVIHKIL